jgi:hypothetical protein
MRWSSASGRGAHTGKLVGRVCESSPLSAGSEAQNDLAACTEQRAPCDLIPGTSSLRERQALRT